MKSIKVLDLYDRIPQKAKDIIGFIADVFSLIGVFCSLYAVIFNTFSNANKISDHIVYVIIIVALLLVVFHQYSQRKKSISQLTGKLQSEIRTTQSIRDTTSKSYYSFLHDYRNEINDLECYYKRNRLTNELLVLSTETLLKNVMNYLSEILSSYSGEKVCCCIKAISVNRSSDVISYDTATVRTFVRSNNTDEERKSRDIKYIADIKISDNTDFREIVSTDRLGNDSVFYQPNLKKYDEYLRKIGKKYENTTDNWEKYYIGTVVVPIRIANQHLFFKDTDEGYDILGFLCADSLSTDAFPLSSKESYTHIMKSFAALTYNIMSKYQFYLAQLNSPVPVLSEATVPSPQEQKNPKQKRQNVLKKSRNHK